MRLLVTGGGTGGHVYPALSILEALEPTSSHEVAWVGRAGGIEETISQSHGLPFYAVDAGALRGANPLSAMVSIAHLMRGTAQALRLVRRWQPEAVLATGGYVSVPLVLAAAIRSCPSLIYLPDMEPGMAVTFLARYAKRVAVSVPSAATFFDGDKVFVSGYPVRSKLYSIERSDAHAALGLDNERPVILVIGGSRGARSINEAVLANLDDFLARAQVIHICGQLDHERLATHRSQLAGVEQKRYHLYPYLDHEMPSALAAADLVVARSGASVIGEMPAVGAPAILVPYPHAGQHQMANARYLADNGAAIIVEDASLDSRLAPELLGLLDDRERLVSMRSAAKSLAMPGAARSIANALLALSGEGGKE